MVFLYIKNPINDTVATKLWSLIQNMSQLEKLLEQFATQAAPTNTIKTYTKKDIIDKLKKAGFINETF